MAPKFEAKAIGALVLRFQSNIISKAPLICSGLAILLGCSDLEGVSDESEFLFLLWFFCILSTNSNEVTCKVKVNATLALTCSRIVIHLSSN